MYLEVNIHSYNAVRTACARNSPVIFHVTQYRKEQVSLNPKHQVPVLWGLMLGIGRAAGSRVGEAGLRKQLPGIWFVSHHLLPGDLIQVCGLHWPQFPLL